MRITENRFDERVENEVIKPHVLKHSRMKAHEYDALARVEYYLHQREHVGLA